MSASMIGGSIIIIAVSLLIAKLIRIKFKIFSKLFLPSSIIAGFLLLILGPEVLGKALSESYTYGIFNENIIEVFRSIPGLLITFIFASLFIGSKIPKIKDILLVAGPQVSFGQTVAWGQYVIGILVTMLILTPIFGANPMVGALIEIAFEGGHGTAAGLADTFDELGFTEGRDLAMGLATIGIVFGVISGVILINWAVRKSHTNFLKTNKEAEESNISNIVPKEERESAAVLTVSPESIEPLALHLGVIALAIGIGKLALEGLRLLENMTWGSGDGFLIIHYMPLFPLAMLGGFVVQLFISKFDFKHIIDRKTIVRLQGLALDLLVVSAIGGLSLTVIGENIVVFLILAFVGIMWNILMFVFIARRMMPKYWFERGIGDFGQSMGMTALGLMLIRIVDSDNKSNALFAFGYKQLLFEPIVGGGLMTAISVPLIFNFGSTAVLIVSMIFMIFWLILGLFYFGKMKQSRIY
ncbi:MAG: sodium:glutamate symporter [Tenericutes bacterium]|nr:sodium:glutamate symporter [Mycoplasmatota bacterium]